MKDRFKTYFYNQNPTIDDETFDKAVLAYTDHGRSKVFNKCIFSDGIDFSGPANLVFTDCTFAGAIARFSVLSNGKIEFKNCKFTCYLAINKATVINITNTESSNTIDIKGGSANFIDINDYSQEGIPIENLKLQNTKGKVVLNGLAVQDVEFIGDHVNEIKMFSTKVGSVRFAGNIVSNLEISDSIVNLFSKNDGVNIAHMTIKNTSFFGFKMNSFSSRPHSISFEGTRFNGVVEMRSSDLSGVKFNGVDFSSAKIKMDRTFLTDATFSNIVWPSNHLLEPDMVSGTSLKNKLKNTAEEYSIHRELYRQFKSVSLKNNNNVDALVFYRNEMRVYWRYVLLKKNEHWLDRVLIFLNRHVSDFGQSYLRPLIFLFAVHYIFYLLFVGIHFPTTLDEWGNGVGQYFYLLNPVHSIPEGVTGIVLVSDFFMRVFAGFFIYHFIRATRKFGKVG